jgi:hypothetical protein
MRSDEACFDLFGAGFLLSFYRKHAIPDICVLLPTISHTHLSSWQLFEISVARKKGIYHYEMTANHLVLHKGLKSLEESHHRNVVCMARFGGTICVGQSAGNKYEYAVIDVKTGERTEVSFLSTGKRSRPVWVAWSLAVT